MAGVVGLPTTLAIAVALTAVSSSAPLIAYAAAPALAIAFWRNALATVVLVPVAALTRRTEFAGLLATRAGRRTGAVALLSGVALAVHFGTWVSSAKLTTVAAATALGATQPVWQGLIALGQGRRLSGGTWLGITVAVSGAALATGADLRVSGGAVLGDLLAVVGGMAAAGYTALGERVRSTVSTTSYTTICYGVCAVLLAPVCLVAGAPLHGYPATTWLAIAGLVIGAQLLGHSLLNFSLRRISATALSVLLLVEVPGAALLGWVWLGQAPRPGSWPGLLMLMLGVGVVLAARRRDDTAASAAVVAATSASGEADGTFAGLPDLPGDGGVAGGGDGLDDTSPDVVRAVDQVGLRGAGEPEHGVRTHLRGGEERAGLVEGGHEPALAPEAGPHHPGVVAE